VYDAEKLFVIEISASTVWWANNRDLFPIHWTNTMRKISSILKFFEIVFHSCSDDGNWKKEKDPFKLTLPLNNNCKLAKSS
jgi:hypothetical protein